MSGRPTHGLAHIDLLERWLAYVRSDRSMHVKKQYNFQGTSEKSCWSHRFFPKYFTSCSRLSIFPGGTIEEFSNAKRCCQIINSIVQSNWLQLNATKTESCAWVLDHRVTTATSGYLDHDGFEIKLCLMLSRFYSQGLLGSLNMTTLLQFNDDLKNHKS